MARHSALTQKQINTLEKALNIQMPSGPAYYEFGIQSADTWNIEVRNVKPKNFGEICRLFKQEFQSTIHAPYYELRISSKKGVIEVDSNIFTDMLKSYKDIKTFIKKRGVSSDFANVLLKTYPKDLNSHVKACLQGVKL